MEDRLLHERLDVYRLAVEVARWVRSTTFPPGESALRDQAKRAADSVVLNLAEGCNSLGGNRNKHYRIARGSAAEVCAVLDLVPLDEAPMRQQQLRRIVFMACRLK